MIIAIGNSNRVSQLPLDRFIIAIRPTRVRCAAAIINISIGHAARNPMPVAFSDILVTITCIWWAIKLSDAPIWFRISSSRRCNIAVLRAMYDMHVPIARIISARIRPDINIMYMPVVDDDFNADACGKKRAVLSIFSANSSIDSGVLNLISHIIGR